MIGFTAKSESAKIKTFLSETVRNFFLKLWEVFFVFYSDRESFVVVFNSNLMSLFCIRGSTGTEKCDVSYCGNFLGFVSVGRFIF
jgi:hypothetical protein